MSLATIFATLLVGWRWSNQIGPPMTLLAFKGNPFVSGSSRIRLKVAHAEKTSTVASGWARANAVAAVASSWFQFVNGCAASAFSSGGPKKRLMKHEVSKDGVRVTESTGPLNDSPTGERCIGGQSTKRKFRAPAVYSSSCAANRAVMMYVISLLSFVYLGAEHQRLLNTN